MDCNRGSDCTVYSPCKNFMISIRKPLLQQYYFSESSLLVSKLLNVFLETRWKNLIHCWNVPVVSKLNGGLRVNLRNFMCILYGKGCIPPILPDPCQLGELVSLLIWLVGNTFVTWGNILLATLAKLPT